jgi:sugar lactone lactonase YvrE
MSHMKKTKVVGIGFVLTLALWAGSGLCLAQAPVMAAKAPGAQVAAPDDIPWPPVLPGAVNGTVTLKGQDLLIVPDAVAELAKDPESAPFIVAKTAPVVELAYHQPLPDAALNGTGWTSWGDIGVAPDGKVYSAIGNHGKDAEGQGKSLLFSWDPKTKTLSKVLDLADVTKRTRGDEPTWSKVHAKIDVTADGSVYLTGTLNAGQRASDLTRYKWSESLPGGQLYKYDPATGKASVVTNLPPARVSATSLLDSKRNRWWCNLEAGPENAQNALLAIDLKTGKGLFQTPNGVVGLNRAFALANDGAIYFNGIPEPRGPEPIVVPPAPGKRAPKPPARIVDTPIMKVDPNTGKVSKTQSLFLGSPGMRSATEEGPDGWVYGSTQSTGQLFRYSPSADTLELLGPDFLKGNYTTVMVRSPDGKYLYYLPGAHGGAVKIGTPVMQYEIATGKRKVIAFLGKAFLDATGYTPGGTYGVKLSADGSTLYANLNGHGSDKDRHPKMRANGFGLTSFIAVHIPESERR